MSRRSGMLLVVAAMVLTASIAQADVFKMLVGQTSLLTVPVGDAGNTADTTGRGAVAYKFHIGKYDVTNAQYCQFLNAKAANGEPYGLWNNKMSSDPNGGINRPGNGYKYVVKPGHTNQPVVFVSWSTAIRFANWLTNGQGNGDTETGTYTITGSGPKWTVVVPDTTQRAAWAAGKKSRWLLPSENEWYKSAYFKGGNIDAGYWKYPTRSNTVPTSQSPPGGSNSANFLDLTTGYAVTGSTQLDSGQNYVTDVGAYPKSLSAYGTLDQGGNVLQWIDTRIGSSRGLRGGDWDDYSVNLASSCGLYAYPTVEIISRSIGFRVASVP